MNAYDRLLGFSLVTIVVGALGACSSDAKTSGVDSPSTGKDGGTPSGSGGAPPASTGNGGAAPTGAAVPKAPFNGDCTTANWGYEDDDCWKCLCGACATQLNGCNEDCTGIFKCAGEKQTLVNVTADISCEIRATGNLCIQDPKAQAATMALLTMDGCLLGAAPNKGSDFRTCDTICKSKYAPAGDVCQRFPMP